jgi:hypothetical protein
MIFLKRFKPSGFILFEEIKQLPKYCGCSLPTIQKLLNESILEGIAKKCKTGYAILGFRKIIQKFYIYDLKIIDKSGDLKSLTEKVMESVAINKLSQQSFKRKKGLLEQQRGNKNKNLLLAKIKDRSFGFECRTSARVMAKTLDCSHVIANRILNSIQKKGFVTFVNFIKDLTKSASYFIYKKTGYFFAVRFLTEISRACSDSLVVLDRDLKKGINPLIM